MEGQARAIMLSMLKIWVNHQTDERKIIRLYFLTNLFCEFDHHSDLPIILSMLMEE